MMSRFFLTARALGLVRSWEFSRHWGEHVASEEAAFARALSGRRAPPIPRIGS
ncbi:hypothetical protein [Pararhodospirillum oryzae]|uniref:Uncharacterized protein n=1 Tax=Pararhodospirillum oryzae TaxID=478448 RepID=A0A512HBY7_9PROT|nr:hypothetical protein [Pararhodospirillum oryzae]GEO82965.1 hypothetical protein ROR02_30960 [Pararhodospirillum oryzae]